MLRQIGLASGSFSNSSMTFLLYIGKTSGNSVPLSLV